MKDTQIRRSVHRPSQDQTATQDNSGSSSSCTKTTMPTRRDSTSRLRSTLKGGIQRRHTSDKSKAFREKMRQMTLPLAPLVQMTTGAVHPCFPTTLLKFWLLTEGQLDDIANFYHQGTPGPWSRQYPCPITWSSDLKVEEKRRKIGKFIGLRGCITPATVRPVSSLDSELSELSNPPRWLKTEEQLMEEARLARLAEDSGEALRRKVGWYL